MNRYLKYFNEVIFLLGKDSRKLPLFILLFILVSVFDLLGIGLIAPYVAIISNPDIFIQSNIYEALISIGLPKNSDDQLIFLGIILVFVFMMKAIGALLINRVILYFCAKQGIKLRSLLMKTYQDMSYIEHTQTNSSEYIYKIQSLVGQYSNNILQAILRLISESIIILAIVIFLAWYNGLALGVFVLLLGSVILIYDIMFRRKVINYGYLINKNSTKMVQGIRESVTGLKEIRILGRENYFNRTVDEASRGYAEANVKSSMISMAPRYLLEFILILFVVVLVCGSIIFGQGVESMLPTLSMFGVASLRLAPSANQITSGITQIRLGRHGVNQLYIDLQKNSQWSDMKSNTKSMHEVEQFKKLELRKISFFYPDTSMPALNNLSLTLNKGESIGLIGMSGSGKTTLVDLLLGLLDQYEGEVIYNGVHIGDKLVDWRLQVAYMPQEIFLIDDTVRRNVALGVDDKEIDNIWLKKSLKYSHLDDIISQLPDGVDTMLGEGGVRLSGGQRQRIALARAFYHNRNVIIMDEATSALDNETEKEIIAEIKRLKGKKTMIVIAHRMSTVQHCDCIYRMDKGEIVKKGDYSEMVLGQTNSTV